VNCSFDMMNAISGFGFDFDCIILFAESVKLEYKTKIFNVLCGAHGPETDQSFLRFMKKRASLLLVGCIYCI